MILAPQHGVTARVHISGTFLQGYRFKKDKYAGKMRLSAILISSWGPIFSVSGHKTDIFWAFAFLCSSSVTRAMPGSRLGDKEEKLPNKMGSRRGCSFKFDSLPQFACCCERVSSLIVAFCICPMFLLVISGKERLKSTNSPRSATEVHVIYILYFIILCPETDHQGLRGRAKLNATDHTEGQRDEEKVEQGTGGDHET